MTEHLPLTAFLMGIASAISLPLGTLSAGVWRPSDRAIAVLMAFGGGALLAALTIDLVGSALAQGHFYHLAAGCIAGGLLFIALNQAINNRGGFLRKSSTTIYHLRRHRQRRFRQVLAHIGRIPVFHGLPAEDTEELAGAVFDVVYPAGTTIYRRHDPSDRLYVIASGEVDLLDPDGDMQPFERLGRNDAFARMAFFTGAPHATVAVARSDVRVWVLPRHALERLLMTSPFLVRAVVALIQGEEVRRYLIDRQHLEAEEVERWARRAVASISAGGPLPAAVEVERHDAALTQVLSQIQRVPIFQGLPPGDIQAIAGRFFSKHHRRGETLFFQDEAAERLYIVESGEVALIDPRNRRTHPIMVGAGEAFGGMSFLTGARHSVSAVATALTTVWVLRKRDFDDLLRRLPQLDARIKDFLQRQEVRAYLKDRHGFDRERSERWMRRAVKRIDSGRLIPSAAEMHEVLPERRGAPVAIWLGILLDGIPESLVIGASLVHAHLSLSLLAGLFLSNYPEALSSSVGMRQQGISFHRVLIMWTSIMLLTGVGAALGNLFFAGAGAEAFALVEGIAAGAMLTMIAQTMLPEAYFKGGSIIGFTTLLGFLAAIFFKTLE